MLLFPLRFAALLFAATSASAQAPDTLAFVRVDASASVAAGRVVVGGVDAGAPGEVLAIPAERAVRVALVEAGAGWNPRRAEVGVVVPAGDTLAVGLALPSRVRIETLPLRASVALDRAGEPLRVLGMAPLLVDLPAGTTGTLVASLDGYREARTALRLSTDQTNLVRLVLAPKAGGVEGALPVTILTTERRQGRRLLIDAGIGALSLAAGVVAVATKFRADGIDDRYRDPASPERGSDDLRSQASRLDRISLVALGTMQVGIGTLALRFILR